MSDSRMYPVGSGYPKSRYQNGMFVDIGERKTQRTRVPLADLNAGYTLLPAIPGVKWRIIDAALIAIGDNFTTGTSVNIKGTRAGSAVNLLVADQTILTQSSVVKMGAANAVVLADGASFTALDNNTAVTVTNVGTDATLITDMDVILTYTADAA